MAQYGGRKSSKGNINLENIGEIHSILKNLIKIDTKERIDNSQNKIDEYTRRRKDLDDRLKRGREEHQRIQREEMRRGRSVDTPSTSSAAAAAPIRKYSELSPYLPPVMEGPKEETRYSYFNFDKTFEEQADAELTVMVPVPVLEEKVDFEVVIPTPEPPPPVVEEKIEPPKPEPPPRVKKIAVVAPTPREDTQGSREGTPVQKSPSKAASPKKEVSPPKDDAKLLKKVTPVQKDLPSKERASPEKVQRQVTPDKILRKLTQKGEASPGKDTTPDKDQHEGTPKTTDSRRNVFSKSPSPTKDKPEESITNMHKQKSQSPKPLSKSVSAAQVNGEVKQKAAIPFRVKNKEQAKVKRAKSLVQERSHKKSLIALTHKAEDSESELTTEVPNKSEAPKPAINGVIKKEPVNSLELKKPETPPRKKSLSPVPSRSEAHRALEKGPLVKTKEISVLGSKKPTEENKPSKTVIALKPVGGKSDDSEKKSSFFSLFKPKLNPTKQDDKSNTTKKDNPFAIALKTVPAKAPVVKTSVPEREEPKPIETKKPNLKITPPAPELTLRQSAPSPPAPQKEEIFINHVNHDHLHEPAHRDAQTDLKLLVQDAEPEILPHNHHHHHHHRDSRPPSRRGSITSTSLKRYGIKKPNRESQTMPLFVSASGKIPAPSFFVRVTTPRRFAPGPPILHPAICVEPEPEFVNRRAPDLIERGEEPCLVLTRIFLKKVPHPHRHSKAAQPQSPEDQKNPFNVNLKSQRFMQKHDLNKNNLARENQQHDTAFKSISLRPVTVSMRQQHQQQAVARLHKKRMHQKFVPRWRREEMMQNGDDSQLNMQNLEETPLEWQNDHLLNPKKAV